MKIGDKVVCIDNKDWTYPIPFNKILTIEDIDSDYIEFEELNLIYRNCRFVTIKEYRKLKLQKIDESRR